MTQRISIEQIRHLRRVYLAEEEELTRLCDEANEPYSTTSDAERYYDAREEQQERRADLYGYALRAIACGALHDHKYAAELALGEHDTDGGLD